MLVVLTETSQISTDVHVTLDRLEQFALPIERADATGLNVLRVPLDIAVNFVVELEGRIDEQRKPGIQNLDTRLCCHATPVGCKREITNDPDTWAGTMRAEAM